MFLRKKRKQLSQEIAPDEIFLDSINPPDFDRYQFEGRLEKPISSHTFIGLSVTLGIIFLVLLLQSGNLQILKGAAYAAESAHNSFKSTTLFAKRGVIVDKNGVLLAYNIKNANSSVRRYYTIPSMGSIIGYVSYPKKDSNGYYYDIKENGLAGLEAQYNTVLSGINGKILTERDALGHIHSQGIIVPTKPGGTLHLSIDASVEKAFADAIAAVAVRNKFLGGAGVIMDVHTGAILAIVSYPSYNPNVMSSGGPAKTIAAYNTAHNNPFLDRAIQGLYAPGSIVKPFIASGALTDGIITPTTVIDDHGFLSIPNKYNPGHPFIYKGWRALGLLTVKKAIAWSSDIFFYTVGGGFGKQKGLGIDRLDYWYNQFGIGEKTGVDLPGEAYGLIPTPKWKKTVLHKPWYLGDTYFTAIGQYAMQVTPIQMARATAAIANGGKLLTPTLLVQQFPFYTTIPVSANALKIVKEGMREGVTTALAQQINFTYLAVAAKTGTAQVGANNQYDNAWVEGFFPYKNPRYAFAVVLGRGPSGKGEKAVTVMHTFFNTLYSQNSPYVNGTGSARASAMSAISNNTPSQ